MTPSVGFAGLGHMGLPMATRLADVLADRDVPLTVWNRTEARAAPLAARGVPVAGSLPELAAASDVLITMLADGRAALEVWRSRSLDDACAAGFADADFSCVAQLLRADTPPHMLSSN